MTVESARAFYERMDSDETFRTQFQTAASSDERRAILQAAGYDFTPEQWEAALAQISESSNEEFSEVELTAVSGGVIIADPPPGGMKWPSKWPIAGPMYGIPFIGNNS